MNRNSLSLSSSLAPTCSLLKFGKIQPNNEDNTPTRLVDQWPPIPCSIVTIIIEEIMQHQRVQARDVTFALVLVAATLLSLVRCGAVSSEWQPAGAQLAAHFDAPALRIISDEDQTIMQQVRQQIDDDFSSFKSIEEVHAFLDKVGLLVQKHPKNVAFAQGDLKDLQKFLSQEIVTKLIRVDTEPFVMPMSDDRMPLAQRAIEEDELTRKLFSGPLRSLIEAKKQQQVSRTEDGQHKDGNFFSNFWCKISGNCSN